MQNDNDGLINHNEKLQKVKILMWNINGISDKLNDPDVKSIIDSHDIIGLVETKKGSKENFNYPDYISYHFSRSYKHHKARRYDGGILLLVSLFFLPPS